MTSILKDKDLSDSLLNNGYAITPFLAAEEMEGLKALFNQHTTIKQDQKGLYSNLFALSPDTNWQISQDLEKLCARPFSETFHNSHLNGGVFIAKGANPDTGCFMHQDPSCTYEDRFTSYSAWIPLVDINESTGLFYVVDGSHKLRQQVRSYNNANKDVDVNVFDKSKVKSLHIKAGQALVFDHALIHGSAANLSPDVRIAVVMGIMPEGAPYTFFWKTNPGEFAVYNMDKEYFLRNRLTLQNGQVEPTLFKETITAPETPPVLPAKANTGNKPTGFFSKLYNRLIGSSAS